VAGTPPGKIQLCVVGLLEELSRNETANGGHPDMGVAEIFATGACAYPLKTAARSKADKDNKRSFLNNGIRFKVDLHHSLQGAWDFSSGGS